MQEPTTHGKISDAAKSRDHGGRDSGHQGEDEAGLSAAGGCSSSKCDCPWTFRSAVGN